MSYRHNRTNRAAYKRRLRMRRTRGGDTAWALRRVELAKRGQIHNLGTKPWSGGRIRRRMERTALRWQIKNAKTTAEADRLKAQLEVLYR